MVALKKLLTYEGLVRYLRDKGYREIREGEFVIGSYEGESEIELLVVRKGDNYKESLGKLRKEIEESASIVEGERKEYGILFVGNYVVFLRRVMLGLIPKVVVLKKSLDKITPAFEKKFKKFLQDVTDPERWELLFDRTDIIEEFYQLYLKARENLINNIKGIPDDKKKEEFADNLMMQLLIIWYLQEKGFLDSNPRYLIEKFREYKNLGFKSYYEFLINLFEVMKGEPNAGIYYVDERFGKIVVTGPAPFLNDDGDFDELWKSVQIPDDVFYIENATEKLTKLEPRKLTSGDVPILNLFESRDWIEGNIDEFVLGAIFEKLMTAEERKEKGAYYTPEAITRYISENTIYPYLIDKINERFDTNYENLQEFFEKENDVEKYKYLYEVLQDLKILDPACGSGHFLETAIDVLVEIYDNLRKRAEELGFDKNTFSILVADEKGNIHRESLLSISNEDAFKLKVKFHIIISKNIYGVDIQKSAINVARARMFLTLAKHFDAKKEIFVRFPNVHFNLRSGNSLVGFIDFSGFERVIVREKQKTLMDFLNKATKKEGSKPRKPLHLRITRELEEYLKKMDEQLGLNTVKLLREIKRIYEQPVSVEGIMKVLEFKGKLMRIMLVSLNSKFAKGIQDILRDVTDAFNDVLNEEFLLYLKRNGVLLNRNELERIGYFHWILEFPEVFFNFNDSGEGTYIGFDIVIGNPPYGEINKIMKDKDLAILVSKIYRKIYSHQGDGRKVNIYKVFLERTSQLIEDGGYFGMIFPSPFLNDSTSVSLRRSMFEDYTVKKILEFPEKTGVFRGSGVTQAVCIVTYAKRKSNDYEFELRTNIRKYEMKDISSLAFIKIKKSALAKLTLNEYVIPLVTSPKEWEILEFLAKFDKVNSLNPIVKQGDINETKDKEFLSDTPDTPKVLLVKGIHFDRFFVNLDPNGPKPRWVKNFTKLGQKYPNVLQQMKEERLGWRAVVNKALIPRLRFALVPKNVVLTHALDFMIVRDTKISLKYLLALFNSHLLDWVYHMFSASNNVTMPEIRRLPIVVPSQNEKEVLETIADYLTFLRYMEYENEREKLFKEVFEQFDKLKDYIVYELYFRDVLYPKPRTPLLDAVSGLLKEIEFDKWIDLYHRKQLGELTDEKEFQELTERNIEVIKEVYNALKENSEVQQLKNTIDQHEWVKLIEARFSRR